jgi:hypothetical protein
MRRQRLSPSALRIRRRGQRCHPLWDRKVGQFVTHAKALPGNPYDGHTLATVLPDMEALAWQHHPCAASYSLRRLIRWLSLLLHQILTALLANR